MKSLRVHVPSLALLAGLILAAISHKASATQEYGQVFVDNTTPFQIKLSCTRYTDSRGTERSVDTFWTIEPNERTRLLRNGSAFRAQGLVVTLEMGGHETRWRVHDADLNDGYYTLRIRTDMLPAHFRATNTLNAGQQYDYRFSSAATRQTVVFRLANTSGRGDVDIYVYDSEGNVVARSNRGGTATDRCMLHADAQERYRVVVKTHGDAARVSYRLDTTTIDHADILVSAAGQEVGKALLGGLVVGLFGDEEDNRNYWRRTGSTAAKDAVALAIMSSLLQYQRENPSVDPLGSGFTNAMRFARSGTGNDFVSVRRAFVDRLSERIQQAARGS